MSKLIIDGNPTSEIDAEDPKKTVHAQDSRFDRSVLKKLEKVGADNREIRDELRTHSANTERLKSDTDLANKELKDMKTTVHRDLEEMKKTVHKELEQVRVENRSIRKELKRMVEGAQVKDAVTALGVGVLAKAIVKKAIPWGKG